jgi:hypothetical protein
MRILMAGFKRDEAAKHFENTVAQPVEWERHAAVLDGVQLQLLRAIHGNKARFWGILPVGSNKRAADEVSPGDQIWFHADNFVQWVATVLTVFRNPALARMLWGAKPDSQTWSQILTVSEPQPASIAKSAIAARVGYQTDFTWQGARLLTEEQSRRLPLIFDLGPTNS